MKRKIEIRNSNKMKDHNRYISTRKANIGSKSNSINTKQRSKYKITDEGIRKHADAVINRNKALLKRLSNL